MAADFARRYWVSNLHDILPTFLLDVLDAIYLNALALAERYSSFSDASLTDMVAAFNLQTLLPPLISILTIYFALLSLYRTTTFFVRSTVFLVKWGALIGVTGAALGYVANTLMPNSLGIFNQGGTRRKPSRSARPRVWDTFEEHQRWREGQREENPYVVDAGKTAREMVEKLVDATQQMANQGGWWGTLSGLAAKTFVGDNVADPVQRKRRTKHAKGKGKSR
ncbi:hypothetical protein JB92DRAFT_2901557 [Gautieria morchelliformis]|nr:hypothetical protein JB92DRAFT_2901557 [Gautieria morchelliformis]